MATGVNCEICGAPARSHHTMIRSGQKEERHLCLTCADARRCPECKGPVLLWLDEKWFLPGGAGPFCRSCYERLREYMDIRHPGPTDPAVTEKALNATNRADGAATFHLPAPVGSFTFTKTADQSFFVDGEPDVLCTEAPPPTVLPAIVDAIERLGGGFARVPLRPPPPAAPFGPSRDDMVSAADAPLGPDPDPIERALTEIADRAQAAREQLLDMRRLMFERQCELRDFLARAERRLPKPKRPSRLARFARLAGAAAAIGGAVSVAAAWWLTS